jgi:hypothetical protein
MEIRCEGFHSIISAHYQYTPSPYTVFRMSLPTLTTLFPSKTPDSSSKPLCKFRYCQPYPCHQHPSTSFPSHPQPLEEREQRPLRHIPSIARLPLNRKRPCTISVNSNTITQPPLLFSEVKGIHKTHLQSDPTPQTPTPQSPMAPK